MFPLVLAKKSALVVGAAITVSLSCRAPRTERILTNANPSTAAQDSLSGTFHIIFDPERYFLIEAVTGKSTELVFQRVNSASPPSLLKYDRRHVNVVGRRDSRSERIFCVSDIAAIEDR